MLPKQVRLMDWIERRALDFLEVDNNATGGAGTFIRLRARESVRPGVGGMKRGAPETLANQGGHKVARTVGAMGGGKGLGRGG